MENILFNYMNSYYYFESNLAKGGVMCTAQSPIISNQKVC